MEPWYSSVETAPPATPSAPYEKGTRGGASIVAAITGAMVAFAAAIVFVLGARAIASYYGYRPLRLPIGGSQGTGLLAALIAGALLVLAFAWGGYTAGRMGRGTGWLNGFLAAAAVAVIAAIGLGGAELVHQGPGLDLHLHLPAGWPHVALLVERWVAAAAGAVLALAGAAVGGALGAGWHTGMERRAHREETERREARESFADLRQAVSEPPPDESPGDYPDTLAHPLPSIARPEPGAERIKISAPIGSSGTSPPRHSITGPLESSGSSAASSSPFDQGLAAGS